MGEVVKVLEQAQSTCKSSDREFLRRVHPDIRIERFKLG